MRWFRLKKLKIAPPKRKRIILRPYGRLYNLEEIYHQINAEYFDSKICAKITWFGCGTSTPKRCMTFGSYSQHLKLIKINRLLDSEAYPEFFVRYIIFHEMLHDLLPPIKGKRGRRDVHHSAFKEKEKTYSQYSQVKEFMKNWKKRHFDTCQ